MLYDKTSPHMFPPGKGLLPLIFRCSQIEDLQRFSLLVSMISVANIRIYRPWSLGRNPSHAITEVDMDSLSLDQAVMEAEFADIVVADLSRFDTIQICSRHLVATIGPATPLSQLIDNCRAASLSPELTARAFASDMTLPIGCQMDRPPCRISRIQSVHARGEIDWAATGDLPAAQISESALLHRLEVPLQPV